MRGEKVEESGWQGSGREVGKYFLSAHGPPQWAYRQHLASYKDIAHIRANDQVSNKLTS